jgi:hypothetical protein
MPEQAARPDLETDSGPMPGTTVLVLAPAGHALAFARVVTDYDRLWYCVEFDDGTMAKRQIPDAETVLPEWMATPADVRAFISREFRRDMTVMRNLGKLSAAQLDALAREEMRLNELERPSSAAGAVSISASQLGLHVGRNSIGGTPNKRVPEDLDQ